MAARDKANSVYSHFVPAVKKDPNWYNRFEFQLITSMEQLRQVFIDAKWTPKTSFISFDTETTGLDFEEIELVGYSFCIDGHSAYYVPVHHFNYPHNLEEPACQFIYDRLTEARKVFLYNARYDMRVFEYIGYKAQKDILDETRWNYVKYDMSKINVFDVMNSVFLADTNIKMPSLKWSSLHFLGIEQVHFDEVIQEAGNFYYLNPSENSEVTYYAAADALCTYLLVSSTMKYFQESKLAGQLDNAVIVPLMHCETEKIWLDLPVIERMLGDCEREIAVLENEVYKAFGYSLNLNSPIQVAQAFERLGIDTGERTSSGNMATGIPVLERLPQEMKDRFPALKSFLRYKEVNKLFSTYFKVYEKEARERGFLRASYKLHGVPTGRLASGKDSSNTFFSPINIQSMPKPHVTYFDVYDLGDQYRNLFSKEHNTIFGYTFLQSSYDQDHNHIKPSDSRYIGQAEGMNPELNVRACLTPKMFKDSNPDEWICAAVDYSGQEIRIAANISHEPVWEEAFLSGGDVHKATAIALWGEENYNRDRRKIAKFASFSVLYGASAATFNDPFRYGISTQAGAEEFYNNYKSKLPTLFQWEDRKIRQARRTGTIYTHFGRPRRVKGYYDGGQAGFASRTTINTQIQGTAGDILKLVLIRLWRRLLNHPSYRDDVKFMCTIHDEVQFGIRASRLNEIVGIIEDAMLITLPEWRVPITTSASLGFTPGSLFEFERVNDNPEKTKWHYVPKLE